MKLYFELAVDAHPAKKNVQTKSGNEPAAILKKCFVDWGNQLSLETRLEQQRIWRQVPPCQQDQSQNGISTFHRMQWVRWGDLRCGADRNGLGWVQPSEGEELIYGRPLHEMPGMEFQPLTWTWLATLYNETPRLRKIHAYESIG